MSILDMSDDEFYVYMLSARDEEDLIWELWQEGHYDD